MDNVYRPSSYEALMEHTPRGKVEHMTTRQTMYGHQPDFTKGHWYTIRCRGCGVVGIGARSDIIALLNEIIYSDKDFELLAYNFTPLYTRPARLHHDVEYNEWVNVNNGTPFNINDTKIISSSELHRPERKMGQKRSYDLYIL